MLSLSLHCFPKFQITCQLREHMKPLAPIPEKKILRILKLCLLNPFKIWSQNFKSCHTAHKPIPRLQTECLY